MKSRKTDPVANRRGLVGFSAKGYSKALFVSPQCRRAKHWVAWRIPGMGEPGGLLSTGSQRVGHD